MEEWKVFKNGGVIMEKWKVFKINGKEVLSYTLFGTFGGEEKATKEQLAYEYNVSVDDIVVEIVEREV